jgi:hypothetical protein
VMTLKAKIRELEGRQRANEFTVGTVIDHGSPFQSPKTREGLSGDFSLNLSSLPSKNFVGDTFCNSQGEEELNLGTSKAGPVKDNAVIRVESVKDYTPYIRYTKLEFKVRNIVYAICFQSFASQCTEILLMRFYCRQLHFSF